MHGHDGPAGLRAVDIGGRRLAYRDVGEGGPVVVLEAGLDYGSDTWSRVQPAVVAFARVMSYDRAGLGASDPAPTPRSVGAMGDDLHALLDAAHIPGPYVLVAHSLGGLIVRLYAHRYPAEVAGMALVASSHPDQWDRWADGVPPETPGESVALAHMRRRLWKDPAHALPEGLDLPASRAQLREATTLDNRPLVVVTPGREGEPSPDWPAALNTHMARVNRELQQELIRLSSNSAQVTAAQSGHFIQTDEPEVVVAAVRRVIDELRNG